MTPGRGCTLYPLTNYDGGYEETVDDQDWRRGVGEDAWLCL